ncbi:MAG: ABC transporter permease [Actinomycetes bacterium]
MTLWETLRMALAALLANKRRSAITVLGVVIGVGAVIAMVAAGSGAQKDVLGSVSSMGSNLIYINAASDTPGGKPLTYDDAEAVSKLMGVAQVAPQAGGVSTIAYGGKSAFCYMFGTTPNYLSIRDARIAVGRFFTQADVQRSARVAVLGLQNADDLGTRDLVGEKVMVGGAPFTVIGILWPRGGTALFNQDQVTLVPITTAMQRVTGTDALFNIIVQVTNPDEMNLVPQRIAELLRQRHRLSPASQDDFVVQSQVDLLGIMGAITTILTALLGGIAAISLLVGGIGIMNIMLVSVTERTREIGIRKALGARRSDILGQFLIESVMLSLLGGIAGVGVGYALALTAAWVFDLSVVIQPSVVLLAFAVSAAVGVFFGVYPAWKASRQDPIEALGYE